MKQLSIHTRNFRYDAIFAAVLLLAIFVNIHHPYLWGPDEPREAEIAREAWQNGEYVYSTFNRIPFVEKPPLYYDLAAGMLALSGSPSPGAARLVSALLGALMAGALYLLARHKLGPRLAALATALLVSMPQFYRAAHWILVDIGVGAFVTAALAIYGYWVLHPGKRESNGMLALFYLAAAAAFLTKGVITLVYLGVVIVPFMIYKRKWLPFRLNWTILVFLVPVAGWIWIFYQKGGIYFLHEHFINNIFGRLLHREFRLPGSPITISDVGHDSRWSFYLERLPNMFGAALAVLPLTLIAAVRSWSGKVRGSVTAPTGKAAPIIQKLFAPFPAEARDWIVYLTCWTFVPIAAFSIPAIKEVTYILPSYAGLALLATEYLRRWLPEFSGNHAPELSAFAVPVTLAAIATQFLAPGALTAAIVVVILLLIGCAALAIQSIRRQKFHICTAAVLAALVIGVILGNTPAVMLKTRLARKCYRNLAYDVWHYVGSRELYIYGGDESIRGALPFYGNRNLTPLVGQQALLDAVANPGSRAIIMTESHWRRLLKSGGQWAEILPRLVQYRPEFPQQADLFIILTAPEK